MILQLKLMIFYVNVGSIETTKAPFSDEHFDSYLSTISTIFVEKSLTGKEFKSVFSH